MSLSEHLAALTAPALVTLLRHRPDVLVEPVPRTPGELAGRLGGTDSLSRALPGMNRDEVVCARTIALFGPLSPEALSSRLRCPAELVDEVLDGLCARGLAWSVDGRVGLPTRLAAHHAAGLDSFRPLAAIVSTVADLRLAIRALGGDPDGLAKPALDARVAELLTDPAVLSRAVDGLPARASSQLAALVNARGYHHGGGLGGPATEALLAAGLLVRGRHRYPELPREVAAGLLAARDVVTGRPVVLPSLDPAGDGRAGADAALTTLTTLLDDSRHRPIAALKKGGVGTRERARLTRSLSVDRPELWIDVAHAAGLLGATTAGYVATETYDHWRDDEPIVRWAAVALAWLALELTPTHRAAVDGEVPPPLPIHSLGGIMRRALLRAAAGGGSLRAAVEHVEWFCPLVHGHEPAEREATLREAVALGVVEGDRLTALGELLVSVGTDPDAAAEVTRRGAGMLPESGGLLVLQSDLTALVSGRPSAAAARLLAACAVSESRGMAATWRFTPASVRGAMDAGWTAEQLRAALVEVSGRDLPQPLDYLVSDVARRHGSVRVRAVRSCVVGAEAEIAELLHTRSLASLHLHRPAPTVLTSPAEPDEVLTRLRAAGFSPLPEDADGVVVLAPSGAGPARAPAPRPTRPRVSATDLAAALLDRPAAPTRSATHEQLSALARHLDDGEVALLADALDHGRDIRIGYRNSAGNRTVRDIRPSGIFDRWLSAWCHLRSAERDFTIANIETVVLGE